MIGALTKKVVSVSCDNAANIVKAVKETFGSKKLIRCIAHTLNLVGKEALNENNVSDLLQKVKDIASWIHQSTLGSDELRRRQFSDGTPADKLKTLIGDVETRWNSVFYMIDRFLDISDSIAATLLKCKKAPNMLLSRDIDVLKDIVCDLQPFERVTREMSSEHFVSGSKVIPIILCLWDHLKNTSPKNNITSDLKANLLLQMNKRFRRIQKVHLFSVATLLDPRFKNLHLSDGQSLGNTISFLRRCLEETDNATSSSGQQIIERKDSKYADIDIWISHKKLVCEMDASNTSELSHFLESPVAELTSDPLKEWQKLAAIYPQLSQLGLKYALVMASSAPSERLFSKAGHTASKTRSRLSPKRLSQLLFLNSLQEEFWEKI